MGPWARSLVSVIVGRAEQPSDEVRDLRVDVGTVSARVGECTVSLSTERVPPRIWAAMTRFAQNRGQLKEAVEGRSQSVHLEHLMSEDWGEPLIPRASAIARACTCDEGGTCEHVTALAFGFAAAIDAAPMALLRWRGCFEGAPEAVVAPLAPLAPEEVADPWQGGSLPEPGTVRALPVGAVLKRLGPSGVHVGEDDLSEILRRAYAALPLSDTR
jgi:hypothetical protein